MHGYRALKQRLMTEFAHDADLKRQIATAASVDAIVAALAASYRAALYEAAAAAADDPTARFRVEGADRAAAARETTILELLAFFERDRAATADVEVRRTGPQALRVVCRQPPAAEQPPGR